MALSSLELDGGEPVSWFWAINTIWEPGSDQDAS